MRQIAFVDLEVDIKTEKIQDIGGVKSDGSVFHSASIAAFMEFLEGAEFVCGHNVFGHDLKYIGNNLHSIGIYTDAIIDTLYLSPLLFPAKPYHALLKDDKLNVDERNNPLNDSIKAKDLFYSELNAFRKLDATMQEIFFFLLRDKKEFRAFFSFIDYSSTRTEIGSLIQEKFSNHICFNAELNAIIDDYPVELAYCLALLSTFIENNNLQSITPPWVLKRFPMVEQLIRKLRNKPCITGCSYCDSVLYAQRGLKKFFGFDSFRKYGGESLQENAVRAAINNKSILAVFPTGGGKSITFQIPAFISGEATSALTVVISPLQSLMKDQVDNLEKIQITTAVTINGLLDPIERAKSIERVENGSAHLLYLSPESLRSKTIENLLLNRKIARFVIDEAHCLSSWGQDFRVDYLYIADFIKSIQAKKNLDETIPVSCFTATAKQKVIEDIQTYFRDNLNIELALFTSKQGRTNLTYTVLEKTNDEEKYQTLRDLIDMKRCPTIVYVSRTKKANKLALRLKEDGFNAKTFHGKMDAKDKTANQDSFIKGETQIIVATSAFGMGVDKKDVKMVVHFEISDSLENYVQEAGRAGRDENMNAECYVLFNEDDLDRHFVLLNQSKLSSKEINQLWKAIKDLTKTRSMISYSALELARKAGWDDGDGGIETRVKTAIAALEQAGYLQRGQNMSRVFADSILSKNATEAITQINGSDKFIGKQKETGARIIRKLFSSRSRKHKSDESAETRIDYIGEHLGLTNFEVIDIITLFREEGILSDAKDLTAYIKKGVHRNRSSQIVETFTKIEMLILDFVSEKASTLNIKEINEEALAQNIYGASSDKIKKLLNFWAIKKWISKSKLHSKSLFSVAVLDSVETLKMKIQKRHQLAYFIVNHLYEKSLYDVSTEDHGKEEIFVEFSVLELKTTFENAQGFFDNEITSAEIEDALFYLSRIEALKIEGGFLVLYNKIKINRTETNNKKQYTQEDHKTLSDFYQGKSQQIHIVGEYARKMTRNPKEALEFVDDYFYLNQSSFLNKYFSTDRQEEIKRNISPSKYKKLFGDLSESQKKIIDDKLSKNIAVFAGPGSGKTKLLVHKMASLLMMEDVKHEQLLMLTFSRASANEFKKRLIDLIGTAAYFVEIKTFHSYCFDLLGKIGNLSKSEDIIPQAIQKIHSKEVESNRLTKTVLLIDEAQDMNEHEYALVHAIIDHNEEIRVIAVGDDDQNIYEFRGASSSNLQDFAHGNNTTTYELVENYRSKKNLVELSNKVVNQIPNRLKSKPIVAHQNELGKIKIVKYRSSNLIEPTVKHITTSNLSGTTGVLTKSNQEAHLITSLLLKNNLKAKLIQSNDEINLFNLIEVRSFLNSIHFTDEAVLIDEEIWSQAEIELKRNFAKSDKLDICLELIKKFKSVHANKKYKSDLESFIRESKLEDFYGSKRDTIIVSTIHKAKGREFDNVFLILPDFFAQKEEEKRQLYVALTRAQTNLAIHTNQQLFELNSIENADYFEDNKHYDEPSEITMNLSHKDVHLDTFIRTQHNFGKMQSGEALHVTEEGCTNAYGKPVLKFSNLFQETINKQRDKGYYLKSAKINFIVYWKKEGETSETRIMLPEVTFCKIFME